MLPAIATAHDTIAITSTNGPPSSVATTADSTPPATKAKLVKRRTRVATTSDHRLMLSTTSGSLAGLSPGGGSVRPVVTGRMQQGSTRRRADREFVHAPAAWVRVGSRREKSG